jgi:predicted small integral membrane protein
MILCWWGGGLLMVRALSGTVSAFNHAKRVSLVALALSLTMWLVVFLSVGGEWFLMWQSKSWNGQEEAFRMFTVVGIVLVVVAQPEIADQP